MMRWLTLGLLLGLVTVTGAQDTISSQNASSVTQLLVLEGHLDSVGDVAFSPDGALIASGGDDTALRLWSTEDGSPLDEQYEHISFVKSVLFSPSDSSVMASAGWDRRIILWDVEDGRASISSTIEGYNAVIERIAFSPDGDQIAFGVGDGVVRIADVESGDILNSIQLDALQITAVAYSPDGETLAVAAGFPETDAVVLDPTSGEILITLEGHSGSVTAIAMHPDGETIFTAGDDGTVRVWQGGEQIESLLQEDWVTDIALSPDGGILAAALQDGTVRLWDVEESAEIAYLEAHDGPVNAVAFNADGTKLASSGEDGLIIVWGIE